MASQATSKFHSQDSLPNELPPEATADYEDETRIRHLERKYIALLADLDIARQRLRKLEEENRKLLDTATSLASAFDRQGSTGCEVAVNALVWELNRSHKDHASEREITLALLKDNGALTYQRNILEQELAQLKAIYLTGKL